MGMKEYVSPEFSELGDLVEFTKNSWSGENFDGQLPEQGPEIFGSWRAKSYIAKNIQIEMSSICFIQLWLQRWRSYTE